MPLHFVAIELFSIVFFGRGGRAVGGAFSYAAQRTNAYIKCAPVVSMCANPQSKYSISSPKY